MALKNTVKAVPLASRNANTFNNTFQLVTTLPQACFLVRIINNSNTLVEVSYDGATAHDIAAAGAILQLQVDTPNQVNSEGARFALGMTIYVLGAAAGIGFIDVAAYYQPTS